MSQTAVETLIRSGTQTPSPDEQDDRSPEERLIDALDCAALRLVTILEDESKDDAGLYMVSFDQRMDVFKTTMQWVATRRRTKIEDPETSQRGVNDMQRRLQEGRQAKQEEENDPYALPKRPRGRPSAADRAERARQTREIEAKRAADEAEKRKNAALDDSLMADRLSALRG